MNGPEFDRSFKESFIHSSIGVVILDSKGKFLEVNEAFCQMLKYPAEELLNLDFPSVTYAGDITDNLKKFNSLLKGEVDYFLAEKRYIQKTGDLVWARSNVTVINNPDSTHQSVLAIVQNIDDIKQSEETLKDAMKYRDEFLKFASHELRTPMTSIKLNAQMLMRSLTQEMDMNLLQRKVEDLVNMTDFGINRINRLIDNMLEISRIQTGTLNVQFDKINLNNVIDSVLSKHSSDLHLAKVRYEVLASEKFFISGDALLIEKVFSNLISNTILYAEDSDLRIVLRKVNDELEISYENTGPAIPKDDQLRIFHRFEKLQSVTNVNGLGLGLFIVKSIVEAHHGWIKLNPDSPGAEFVIRLKLVN